MSEQAADFLARAQEGMGSRFQSQASIDESNARREKEWKEAYARIGQEPPKQEEYVHDGRTLYERIEDHKRKNTEEWDEKMKLANQYRGINLDEQRFLDERHAEKMAAQKKIDDEVKREMEAYRQALAARRAGEIPDTSSPGESTPQAGPSSTKPPSTTATARRPLPTKSGKKDVKSLMKGVVVKKKAPASAAGQIAPGSGSGLASGSSPASPAPGPEGARRGIGPTAEERISTGKVDAAGVTALGKRLAQDEPQRPDMRSEDEKRQKVEEDSRPNNEAAT